VSVTPESFELQLEAAGRAGRVLARALAALDREKLVDEALDVLIESADRLLERVDAGVRELLLVHEPFEQVGEREVAVDEAQRESLSESAGLKIVEARQRFAEGVAHLRTLVDEGASVKEQA